MPFLKYRRVKSLYGVLHILGLSRNILSISIRSDASVHVIFEKDSGNKI
jgi:hypothetical protein